MAAEFGDYFLARDSFILSGLWTKANLMIAWCILTEQDVSAYLVWKTEKCHLLGILDLQLRISLILVFSSGVWLLTLYSNLPMQILRLSTHPLDPPSDFYQCLTIFDSG